MPLRKIVNTIKNVSDVFAASNSRQTSRFSSSSGTSSNRTHLAYPQTSKGKDTDWMQIRGFEYLEEGENNKMIDIKRSDRPGNDGIKQIDINPVNRYSSRFDPTIKNEKVNIQLPIPQGLSDTNAVSWGEDTINPLQQAMVAGGMGIMAGNNPMNSIQQLMEQVQSGAAGVSEDEQEMLMTYLSGKAAEIAGGNVNAAQLVTRATGKIVQSNLELLFENVMLRQFSFTWDFSPRNPNEADEVKHIIKNLKQGMAPQDGSPTSDVGTGSSGWFIGSPYVWQLDYKKGGSSHPFLHKFKPCALTSVSMNYAGSGMYASYSDGTPVHMTMSCNFKEINPVYNQDYDHASAGQGVGY